MLTLIASLASFAVAGAVSSVPVSITIMILLSPKPRHGALPFLFGSLAGSIVVVGLSALGLRLLPGRPSLNQIAVPAFLGIVAGAALAAYSVYLFSRTPPASAGRLEKLRSRFDSAQVWKFAALGVGLNLRPKAILLAVAAGGLIGVRDQSPVEATALVLAYAAVAQSAVVGPILVWLRSPDQAQSKLTALHAWLQRNGRTITAAVSLAVGLFLVGYNLIQLD